MALSKTTVWKKISGYIAPIYNGGVSILIKGANKYINFHIVSGESGYGIRDNSGSMQFKDNNGSWQDIASSGATATPSDWEALESYVRESNIITVNLNSDGYIHSKVYINGTIAYSFLEGRIHTKTISGTFPGGTTPMRVKTFNFNSDGLQITPNYT